MDASAVIRAVRQSMVELQQRGQFVVNITALGKYLDALEHQVAYSRAESATDVQVRIAQAQMQHSGWMQTAHEVQDSAKSTLNTVMLINGGAAVAVLGLVGTANSLRVANLMSLPLLDFGLGVLAGAICFATRYFSGAAALQAGIKNPTEPNLARSAWLDAVTITVGISSIVLFGFGIGNAYIAIR